MSTRSSVQEYHQQQAEEVPAWADELLALKAIYERIFRSTRGSLAVPHQRLTASAVPTTPTSSTSPVAVMVIQYTPLPKKPPE